MLTFPATNAIRGSRPAGPQRPDQRERGDGLPSAEAAADRTGARAGLVVHLELPERGPVVSGSEPPDTVVDLHRLARAVEDLVRVAAPSVITRVVVEPAGAEPASTSEASPRLRPVPSQAGGARPEPPAPAASSSPADGAQDGIDIDLVGRTLRVDSEAGELTRREFDLLAYLHGRRAVALSRRELMNAVWQTGYLAGDRTIDVHVRRVRAKLGRHATRLTTLRGFGYRFD